MPRTTPSAQFVGGPLDGQTFWKHTKGHWTLYLDNTGKRITPQNGDRIVRRRSEPGCYMHREERIGGTSHFIHVYRHTSTLPRGA